MMVIPKKKSNSKLNYGKFAFTTAEVLIVIVVLGLIATFFIPNVYNKYREKVLVSQLEQTYSDMKTAFIRAQAEKNINTWKFTTQPCLKDMFNMYDLALFSTPYGDGGGTKYWLVDPLYKNITYKSVTRSKYVSHWANGFYFCNRNGHLITSIGCIYTTYATKSGPIFYCMTGTYWFVDINGPKGPNIGGIDLFRFYITKDGVKPANKCSCEGGYDCTQYVLDNKNMNYLKNCYVPPY